VLVAVVNGEERLFSQKAACPECGRSVPQLEPRSFSFNSPYGACDVCAGLGSKWSFDPLKVIVTIQAAARRRAWADEQFDAHGGARGAVRRAVDDRYLEAVRELPKKTQNAAAEWRTGFPGCSGCCRRSSTRPAKRTARWLMEYMSPTECGACCGKRLKPESLAVRVKA
jgi:excinuclease ABC subunit A